MCFIYILVLYLKEAEIWDFMFAKSEVNLITDRVLYKIVSFRVSFKCDSRIKSSLKAHGSSFIVIETSILFQLHPTFNYDNPGPRVMSASFIFN